MLTRILATTALALVLASPAMSQQQDRPQGQQAEQRSPDERPTDQLTLADAGTLDGAKVRNRQGDQIGEIEELVLDVKKGELAYAIVGVGGFLGVGEKSVAVPWDRLQPASQPQSFVMNVDRQTLENAPSVDVANLAQLDDPQSRKEISSFWQQAESQQAQTPQQEQQQPQRESR